VQNQNSFIERVKREIRIENYISRFVKLKKQGKRAVGLCPFHTEKSPSFTVSINLGFYYCFGCGKSGDIINFVKDFDKVDFRRALEILSEYSGIPLETTSNASEAQEKEELYKLNEEYLRYFQENLQSSEGRQAREYLQSRKISDSEIQRFELGFSLPGYENSITKLLSHPTKRKNAQKLGLIKSKSSGSGAYDFFRERIMFPIRDLSGRVCGFGGRTFKESQEAKYINSPASPIYDKGKMFYGLYQSQASIRKNRKVILVEGYLDVIGLHSREIENVLAPLGTSLTNHQVRYIKNLADEILLFFDGDSAGKKAALRGAEICLNEGMESWIVLLTGGKDPFDLSKEKTHVELMEILSEKISQSKFILSQTLENVESNSPPELKKKALENLYRLIQSIEKETDKELYAKEGARQLGLSISSVWTDFKKGGKVSFASIEVDNKIDKKKPSGSISPLEKCERELIALLLLNSELFEFVEELSSLEFQDPESESLWNVLYEKYRNSEELGVGIFEEIPDSTKKAIMPFVFEKESENNPESEEELRLKKEAFKDLLKRHRMLCIEKELKELEIRNHSNISQLKENMSKIVQLRSEKLKLEEAIRLRNPVR
jgi:DNA primase